jgi:hypothetical protein
MKVALTGGAYTAHSVTAHSVIASAQRAQEVLLWH